MSGTTAYVSRLAIIALIVQLMTPWQALHLGMMEVGSGEARHAHCPTSSFAQSNTHQTMNHDGDASAILAGHDLGPDTNPESLSDTCERACGLALSEPIIIALRPMVSGSTIIHARDAFLNPLFLKVPNPPPIA